MISPFAFVLMPFDKAFDDIYKLGIQAAATEAGVVAERVDEQRFSESILDRIYRQIVAADIIVADMTSRNSNVFYEVGYAHAKGKLCILLAQNVDDIPFDLKHHRHLIYENSISKLKPKLAEEFAWLKTELKKEKTESVTLSVKSATGMLSKNASWIDGELELVFDIKNLSDRRSPEIEAMYVCASRGWKFEQDGKDCSSIVMEGEPDVLKSFVKLPVNRLSIGAWAPLKLNGKKLLWSKYKGDVQQEVYRAKGILRIEIVTSEGNLNQEFNLDVEFDEIPF